MRFGTRNLYYLRISSHAILPLYLYLDEQHVDWMSEQVLQHVLADLRPLIPIKLMNEPDIFSSSSSSGKKTGTLDVHRGDTYQFGYFLRKSDPHVVVVKTRNFVAAPPATTTTTTRTKPQPHNSKATTKRKSKPKSTATKRKREAIEKEKEKKTDVNKNKKLRTKAKGKGKQRAVDTDEEEEEEPIEISSEDEDEFGESNLDVPTIPRRSTRSRKVIAGGYRDDDDDEVLEVQMGGATAPAAEQEPEAMDVDVENPPEAQTAPTNPTVPSLDDDNLITMDEEEEPMMPPPTQPPSIKREETETPLNVGDIGETIDVDSYENPNLTSTSTSTSQPPPNPPPDEEYIHHPLEISEDEKEEKPKPILKLQYSGFNIHERCLCVIVEPYPPIRSSTQRSASLISTGLIPPNRQSSIAPPDFVMSSSSISMGKLRARTPLFLPDDDDEYDNIRGETPGPSMGLQRSRPPVPLFHEGAATEEDEDNDNGGMFELSQILQSVGGHTAIAAEDEDEMEGAVFFGDADENREL